MYKNLLLVAIFVSNSLLAIGPSIECRFGALDDDGEVAFDEAITYTLNPITGVKGFFDPYSIDISVIADALLISIDLKRDTISELFVPLINIINFPVGASLFGLNTVFHDEEDDLVSIHYECIKIW